MEVKDESWRRQCQLMQAQTQTDKIKLGPILDGIDDDAPFGQVFKQTLLILRHGGFRDQPLDRVLEGAARLIVYGVTVRILVNGKF